MIETRYGVSIVRAKQVFTAVPVDQPDAGILGLQPSEPVLQITRTTYDTANLVVEFAMSATRSGYPVETIMERRPPSGPQEHPGDLQ